MAVEETTVGVPVITPVVGLNTKPFGKDGETDQVTTAPPLTVGASGAIAESLVSVNGAPLYEIDGTTSLTVMSMVIVSLPPVFVAVTV